MRFVETPIDGVYVVELERHEDERGFFARAWCRDELAAAGLTAELAQCSLSRNTVAGTLRGMHYQRSPHEEAKLVRCTRGAIFDVALDLRPDSATHGRWFGAELDAASGALCTSPKDAVTGSRPSSDDDRRLLHDLRTVRPEAAAGVRWDDPAFGIAWPVASSRTISEPRPVVARLIGPRCPERTSSPCSCELVGRVGELGEGDPRLRGRRRRGSLRRR